MFFDRIRVSPFGGLKREEKRRGEKRREKTKERRRKKEEKGKEKKESRTCKRREQAKTKEILSKNLGSWDIETHITTNIHMIFFLKKGKQTEKLSDGYIYSIELATINKINTKRKKINKGK